MFILRGRIDGGETIYTLEYNDGKVSGDRFAVERILAESKVNHGFVGLVPTGTSNPKEYLSDDLTAHCLASAFVFSEIIEDKNDFEPYNDKAIY